ncbi:hypothetical protein pb186bvf_009594 [Paramecium bursaria]
MKKRGRQPLFQEQQARCKKCNKLQQINMVQWHESQCRVEKPLIDQIADGGNKLVRGVSRGLERFGRNMQQTTNQIANKFQLVFRQFVSPPRSGLNDFQNDMDRNSGFQRNFAEHIDDQLIEIRFQQNRNHSPSNKICSICMEEFIQNEEMMMMQCLHKFHKQCLNDWLRQKPNCPVCKYTIKQ